MKSIFHFKLEKTESYSVSKWGYLFPPFFSLSLHDEFCSNTCFKAQKRLYPELTTGP